MPAEEVNWMYVDWSDGRYPAIRPWMEGEEKLTGREAAIEIEVKAAREIAHWTAIRNAAKRRLRQQ